MPRKRVLLSPALLLLLFVLGAAFCDLRLLAEPLERREPPRSMHPFRLTDIHGSPQQVEPTEEARLTVICFMGTECPLAKLYAARLATMASEFANRNVRFLAISSNQQDSMDDVKSFAQQHGIGFPFLKDYRNVVADQFQASRTPEVFVLDELFWIRYQGRIDDQYSPGIARSKTNRQDLRIAIEELLAGRQVSHPYQAATGCLIGRVRDPVESSDVSYCKQVSRIFQSHCVACHRPGEIGPFSLTDYEEAVGWADTILEVIDDGRMPPWHADPAHGEFANARHLPDSVRATLAKWVDNGLPYGDPADLPEPTHFTDGWRLPRAPDMVLEMNERPFLVPSEGTVEYQYFVVDPGFEKDMWVKSAQVLPGNHSVVHHSIVFIRPPDGSEFRGIGWLAAYVPGQQALDSPAGAAIRVPAKSKLVFQQHYTPTGTDQADMTRIAMIFAEDSDIRHEIYSIIGIDQEFEIPPHSSDTIVRDKIRDFPKRADLLAIMPHMHLRGKSFRLTSHSSERSTILLDVPRYDFNWQHSYQLAAPLPLSQVDELEFEVTFDNSAANPFNPDPSQFVTWGDQTWEEMAVVFLAISVPRQSEAAVESTASDDRAEETPVALPADVLARMKAEADRIVRRFDVNGDGVVTKYETPIAFRRFSFGNIDADRDGRLTRQEIEKAARWRVQ